MNLAEIQIVSIPVADARVAKRFYQDVLGFELVREHPMSKDEVWIQLAPSNNSSTSIALVTWFEKMPPGSIQGLVLSSNNIESDYQELNQKGVKLSPIQAASWGKSTMFEDPDGNGWILQESKNSL